jgi:hypothetical protein
LLRAHEPPLQAIPGQRDLSAARRRRRVRRVLVPNRTTFAVSALPAASTAPAAVILTARRTASRSRQRTAKPAEADRQC